MPFRTRVWSAGKLVVIVVALLATYLLFAVAAARLALTAREVQVPDLRDHTANEATALTASLGLTLKVDEVRRLDPKIRAERVIAQDPAAGSTARPQRSVRVWLSAGQRASTVPALTGETERAAELRLAQDGLALTGVAEIRSQDYPSDLVIAQTPAPRSTATSVTLLVNRGDRGVNYVMPDLIGIDGDRAAEILRGRGFRIAVVASAPYPGVAAGIVIRQSPQAGFQIAPGEAISLEVSR